MTVPLPPSLTPSPSHRTRHIVWIIILLGAVSAVVWYFYPALSGAIQTDGGIADSGAGKHEHGKGEDGTHGGSGSHSGRGGRNGPDSGAPTPVTVVEIRKGDIDVIRRALGTVTALANITVRTQVNGLLMEIGFKEGQLVQKGDFLAQVDPRPYQNALEQATGNLQRDQALLKDAQLNLERYKKLVTQDSISKQQADTQASLVQQYEGDIVADKSQIDAANLNLTYAHIEAPVTGRVGLRQVDAGNYVQTSDANGIVTITELQPISVIFTLPEDDVPAVSKLYNAGAELTATAYDRTQSTKLATGRLSALDNQIDTTTGTVKLRAEFDNSDNALFPNQFVNIELKISTEHDATIAPSASIQRGSNGTFVYKLKDDNTVAVQPIKIGTTQGDNVQITDGLAPGDKVVTEGTDKLRDGAHVAVK